MVAATFEKANTYVFAAPIIRGREVGGSNPLAPTNHFKHTYGDHLARLFQTFDQDGVVKVSAANEGESIVIS